MGTGLQAKPAVGHMTLVVYLFTYFSCLLQVRCTFSSFFGD